MVQHPVDVLDAAEGHLESLSASTQRGDMTRPVRAKAGLEAFEMAGVTHKEIALAKIYACFTCVVLCQLEYMGFCKNGEGGAFVEAAHLRLRDELPNTTHGRLLNQAHMRGMNHIKQIVRQLR